MRVYSGLSIAAVVPAHNEEKLIGRTVATMPRLVDHVIVIDDGSTDATAQRALERGDGRFAMVRHPQNLGVGAAIVSGYRAALSCRADVVVVMAGDGQMDPDEIDRLLEPIAVGTADYVKGYRLGHPELARRMPATRRVGNRVLSALTRAATGDRSLRDTQCGYTAISRRALEALPLDRVWPRYGYPNDLLAHMQAARLRVVDRPVTPIYGDEQSGIRPLSAIPTFVYVLARTWVRCRVRS